MQRRYKGSFVGRVLPLGHLSAGLLTGLMVCTVEAAELVAHWRMDEGAAPFVDESRNKLRLLQDAGAASAVSGVGLVGTAGYLNWVSGLSATRLYASDAPLQTDSFGFSFWINPVNLNPFDSLLTKEMPFDNSIPNFERFAWQVHVMDNNGSGRAAIQLIVRGDQRAQGNFFGAVQSSVTLPLATNTPAWYHVAGGYDAGTGALRLYVNGVETISGNGAPGARNSGGAPLVLGSARNGADFVTFSAIAFMDDVQLYGEALSASEVDYLRAHPGEHLREVIITGLARSPGTGSPVVTFEGKGGRSYDLSVGDRPGAMVLAMSVTNDRPLVHDGATAAPLPGSGISGEGAQLRWVSPETTATRLSCTDGSLQTDSFGFSVWIKPNNINPFDNIMAKEMAAAGTGDLFTRMSWQVQVMNDVSGKAPVQLIVRGDDRGLGDFYGTATSAAVVPLYSASPYWIHIAGGYDAATGAMRLFVNGVETVSGNSSPGARNSGGGALSVGSVRNGPDFVAFAAALHVDDVQVYDGILSLSDAVFLRNNPGSPLLSLPRLTAHWSLDEESAPFADASPLYRSASATLPSSLLDSLLGPGAGAARIFRVTEGDGP